MKTTTMVFLCLLGFVLFSYKTDDIKTGNIQKDIVYKRIGNLSLKLDIRIPDGKGPFPTVIYVHGGGLRTGSKSGNEIKLIGNDLLKADYSIISIDYRLYPQAHFPDPVSDVESAIRYVKENAQKLKVDLKRIVLMGGSSGGYLISFVAASGLRDNQVSAVVPLWGVYDYPARYEKEMKDRKFVNDSLFWRDFFNVKENDPKELFFDRMKKGSTINMIKKGMPPFLLVHGTSDSTVHYLQAVRFQNKMKELGNNCELITVKGASHGGSTLTKDPGTIQMIIKWLNKTLR
jgi:alpha-L-fucosidase 2